MALFRITFCVDSGSTHTERVTTDTFAFAVNHTGTGLNSQMIQPDDCAGGTTHENFEFTWKACRDSSNEVCVEITEISRDAKDKKLRAPYKLNVAALVQKKWIQDGRDMLEGDTLQEPTSTYGDGGEFVRLVSSEL